MARTTKDRQALQALGEQGQFAQELRDWLDAWKQHKKKETGRYDIADAEFAAAVGIATATLSRYINAEGGMPSYDACKAIAAVVHVPEDYVLKLARRPNFPDFIERIQKDPSARLWEDGKFILWLLNLTSNATWIQSRSFWKDKAERALQLHWRGTDIHEAAREIAEYIYAWVIDRKREMPFQARPKEAVF